MLDPIWVSKGIPIQQSNEIDKIPWEHQNTCDNLFEFPIEIVNPSPR
jgi:hypothetical protein